MSAEFLREAATVLRERASTALRDEAIEPWIAAPMLDPDNNGWYVGNHIPEADWDTTVAQFPYDYDGKVAPYVATVHPAVGLTVADWLDLVVAGRVAIDGIAEIRSRNGAGWIGGDPASQVFVDMETAALAVAAVILGRSA